MGNFREELRVCFRKALSDYFKSLNGHTARGLRALAVRVVEEELLRECVARCNGNRSEAAKLLGISRTTLSRKLAALDGQNGAAAASESESTRRAARRAKTPPQSSQRKSVQVSRARHAETRASA